MFSVQALINFGVDVLKKFLVMTLLLTPARIADDIDPFPTRIRGLCAHHIQANYGTRRTRPCCVHAACSG